MMTTPEDLLSLSKRIKNEPFIAIDTEFVRESTYFPELCLIQVGFRDEIHLIDPLAAGMDLSPFIEHVLLNPDVVKVFHAARQDLEIFYNLTGKVIGPVFDTQIAAMVCGFGESVGYETLVKHFCEKGLSKHHRYSNWAARPLSEGQQKYAREDVLYLSTIYQELYQQLTQTNRLDWVEEEHFKLIHEGLYNIDPLKEWQRLKPKSKDLDFLHRLQKLAACREKTARELNKPKSRMMKDEVMLEVAAANPQSMDDFKTIRSLKYYPMKEANLERLLDCLLKHDDIPENVRAKPLENDISLKPKHKPALELLKVLLNHQAAMHNVAERMIASKPELIRFLKGETENIGFLKGWRFDIFGRHAEKLQNGTLSLKLNGRIVEIAESTE